MCTSSMLTSLRPASANSRASSPGWSGTETKTDRVGRDRTAVLARDRLGAGDPLGQQRLECGPVAGLDGRHHGVQALADLAEQGQHRVRVGRDDLPVERRVARGHPGDVADALPGEREVLVGRVREPARRPARPAGAARATCAPPPGRARPG